MSDTLVWAPPTSVRFAPHPFRSEALTLELPHGQTLAEIVAACGIPAWATARVWIDDWEIAPAHWATTRPRAGRRVTVRAIPTGGGGGDRNKTLRLVLMVVVLIIAAVVTWGVGAALAGTAFAAYGGVAGALAGGIVSAAGMMAVNALLPPPKPRMRDTTSSATSPTYSLTGTRNQLAPYQPVPRVYGRHRLFPPLAAYPVTWGSGNTNSLSQLFTCGYGPLVIEDIRIGETPIGHYEQVTLEVREGWDGDLPLETYPFAQYEEPLGIDLTPPTGYTLNQATRTTRADADQIGVEVVYPRGLIRIDDKNQSFPFGGQLIIDAVPLTSGALIRLVDQWIEEQRSEPLRFSWAWNMRAFGLPRQAYQITITWQIPAGWEGAEKPNPIVVYDCAWSALRSARYEDPITLPNMSKIGLTIQASGQLTGVVDQLNVVATSRLPVWTGADWSTGSWTLQPTSNPAWIFLDILTGAANARPLPAANIDYDRLLAWAHDCDARGYTFNAVLDSQSTVFEVLALVAAAGRAAFSLRDGKFSIVMDRPQTTPVQLFTPRNSSGFSGARIFVELPHALKVKWINPDQHWQQDERIVYDDGYSEATATKFEGLELFGCTSRDLAWRHGRYWLAAARLRPETYTLGVDVESLVAQRGDLVAVQHDVPLWGYAAGRIVTVNRDAGGLVTALAIDECLDDVAPDTVLWLRIRDQAGALHLVAAGATPVPADRITWFGPTPVALPIAPGDLVSVGEQGTETVPCVISRIEAGANLSARLTLVDAAPGIDLADQGPIPPWQSYISHRPTVNHLPPLPPVIDSVASDELAMLQVGGAWVTTIRVSAHAQLAPDRLTPTLLEAQFRPVGSMAQWLQAPVQGTTAATWYLQPVDEGREYDIRVRAVAGPQSVASEWTTVRHRVVGEATPPPAPINLQLDADQTHLRWQYPTPPPDFPGGFRVRLLAGVSGVWEQAAPLHDGLVSDSTFALPPLGTGTYTFLVKAVDRTGHESIAAALLVAEIVSDPTNILARTEYDPLFPGTRIGLDLLTEPPPPRLCNQLTSDGPFWRWDTGAFWSADAAEFWGGVYGAGSYEIGVDFLPEDAGTTLTLDWAGTGPWIVEYRTGGASLFWVSDPALFWKSAGTTPAPEPEPPPPDPDPLAAVALTTAGDTTDRATYTTASITPTANALVLAWVRSAQVGGAPVPTLTGNGLTWVQVATVPYGTIASPVSRLTLFRAMGASPTPGAVSIAFGATQLGATWAIVELTGAEPGGTAGSAAIVQSATNRVDGSPSSFTVTLAAYAATVNAGVAGFAWGSGTAATPGAGWTELSEQVVGSLPNMGTQTEWNTTNDTTADITGLAAASNLAGIAVEVARASARSGRA